jgi:hypothetical protein
VIGDNTEKFICKALDEGVVTGVFKTYKDLATRVGKIKVGLGLEITFNNENLCTDLSGKWARTVESLC